MQLHEIKFKSLDVLPMPGWATAQLAPDCRIWRTPSGNYSIERRKPDGYLSMAHYDIDTLTIQCILHDIFK